ncbi:MAG: histidine--tRNA ligase [Parcubacteria group bacterium]|nr:histidine--tRNA ligase [Parcubacteria group bacterium]
MTNRKQKASQSVKGMHDILPEDQPYWNFILKKGKTLLEDYGFGRIDTPIVEYSDIFLRTLGEGTDIIDKEIYRFKTKGGDDVSLRPEFTASIARAYIEHGMQNLPQPVKLYTFGPVFRHDQPQAGRYRQFHNLDAEIIGDDSAATDAELIFILYRLFEYLGFKELTVKINNIGDKLCRPEYVKALKDYYRNKVKKLCPVCQNRFKTNILRVLDCAEANCKEIIQGAPQILDFLDENCKHHLKLVLEFLDEINVPYILDPYLVRGLDYYTRTVFEVWTEESSETQLQLASGGRYDRLIEQLGGHKTPASGWGLGVDRVVLMMKQLNLPVDEKQIKPKVFLAQLGDLGKKKSLLLFEEFRKAGIPIHATVGRDSIKSQLRIAGKLGVRFTLIMGQKEALEKMVILRDMESSVQETVPLEVIVQEVKKRLREK